VTPLFHTVLYHGKGKHHNFFEGWYFKIVDKQHQNAFAFIPGVSLGKRGETPRAFVQFLSGEQESSHFFPFDMSMFRSDPRVFSVFVGPNHFHENGLEVNLQSQYNHIRGKISFGPLFGWPQPWYSPGVMGPFSFVPFLECNHGVVSMDHELSGEVDINGKTYDFTGGRGYIEKDWGRSFPKAWVWMQSNSFDLPRTSLFLSIATIPWIGFRFTGFLCGFLLDGKLHRFATYTGASLSVSFPSEEEVQVQIQKAKTQLRIHAKKQPGSELLSPVRGSMQGRINESLASTIHVHFLQNGRTMFDQEGKCAGLENVGPLTPQ